MTLERLLMPDETFATVCDELADVIRRVESRTPGLETRLRRVPGTRATLDHVALLTDERSPVARAMVEAARRVQSSASRPAVLTNWSDAGMLAAFGGMPAVVLGPGEPRDALGRRESVTFEAVHEAARLYAAAALAFCEGIASSKGSLV